MTTTRDVVMTCCRDEEDIVATFARFYLRVGFDAVHVIDNGSVDRTPEIVRGLIAEGLPITLEQDPRTGYERHLTEWFQRTGERLSARWLFFLDSDEFILFPDSWPSYRDGLPVGVNRLRLRQKEVYPVPAADPPMPFLLSRRIEPHFNDTTKDVTRFDPLARVYAGKHEIDLSGARTLVPANIFIRHYKYRTLQQAARKEQNRCADQRVYSDKDLGAISVFGVEVAREWIRHCERAAAQGHWRKSFRSDAPAVEDHAMADWASRFLDELAPAFLGLSTGGTR